MKLATLSNLRKEENSENGTARLVITCETENGAHDLWFEVDAKYGPYICDDRCDSAVVALFTTAMYFGYDTIRSDIPISKELFYNLTYHVIPQFAEMDEGRYPELLLDMPVTDMVFDGAAVGAGMSGGIDSFSTLYEYGHHGEVGLEGYGITHLTYNNVGAHHGQDIRLGNSKFTSRELYEGQLRKMRRFCDSFGYELVVTDSNLSGFLAAAFGRVYFSRFHTFRNVSAAMVLQKMYRLYYYSSARNLTGFKFSFKVPSAAYEKWLLPYLDTGSMQFYNSNRAWGRLEKTQRVAQIDASYDYLTVCLIGIDNCGECDKCRETLMGLDILGDEVLDCYAKSFDLEKYRSKYRDLWFSQIYELKEKPSFYQHDMQEIYDYGVAHRSPLIKEPQLEHVYEEGTVARARRELVDVRTMPSAAAPLVCRVQKSSPVKCVGSHGDWLKVRLANGAGGYSKSECYKIIPPICLEKSARGIALERSALRVLPDEREKDVSWLAPGQKVACLYSSGVWWYTRTPAGDEGYVLKKHIRLCGVRHTVGRVLRSWR